MALSEFIQKRSVEPDGRWRFIFGLIWRNFGWQGLVAYWLFIALIFLLIAYFGDKK